MGEQPTWMRARWPLKVDRLAVSDCSSPMSASTLLKAGREAGLSAGSARPARAMRAARPSAFIVAVLPPVLGPAAGGGAGGQLCRSGAP